MILPIHQDIVQHCPVCRVGIVQGQVQFSAGSKGTRARLYARVCRYVSSQSCINQNKGLIGKVMRVDGFPSEKRPLKRFIKTQALAKHND